MRLSVAWLLLGLAGAFYPDPTRAQPAGPGGPIAVDPTGEPRFVVRVVNFEAFDETGWDWTGSDEVVFTFRTPQYVLISDKFGNVDSNGDTHAFNAKATCILRAIDSGQYPDGIWQCSEQGVPAPISFVVGAYEQDVTLSEFVGFFFGMFSAAPIPEGTDIRASSYAPLHEYWPNHLIGKDDVHRSLSYLLERLPEVGQKYTENIVLKGACDRSESDEPCDDNEPKYSVTYEITRVSNATAVAPVTPNP